MDKLTIAGTETEGQIFKFEDEQYHSSLHGTTRTITTALDKLVLTQESPPPPGTFAVNEQHDLVVFADTVIVRGKLSLPGRKVEIHARVVGSNQAAGKSRPAIDVGGAPGAAAMPAGPKLPAAGSLPGKPGAAGAKGTDGAPGGTIEIYTAGFMPGTRLALTADGGAGGKGQDGQGGQDGGAGATGENAEEHAIWNSAYPDWVGGSGGHPGAPGGAGGAGGTGGTGSGGGTMKVHAVDNYDLNALLNLSAFGGAGGKGGSGSKGGWGGHGGAPGGHSGKGFGAGGAGGAGGNAGNGGSNGVGGKIDITPLRTKSQGLSPSWVCVIYSANAGTVSTLVIRHSVLLKAQSLPAQDTVWDILVPGNFASGPATDLLMYGRQAGIIGISATEANDALIQPAILVKGQRKSWDLIVPGNFSKNKLTDLLFYDRKAGELLISPSVGHIGQDGTLLRGERKSWDLIVSGNFTGEEFSELVFYDRKAGELEIRSTIRDGVLEPVSMLRDQRKSWDLIVSGNFTGGEFSDLLLYDRKAGDIAVFASDGKGGLEQRHLLHDRRKTWDVIVSGNFAGVIGEVGLLCYDRHKGDAAIYNFDRHGDMVLLRPFPMFGQLDNNKVEGVVSGHIDASQWLRQGVSSLGAGDPGNVGNGGAGRGAAASGALGHEGSPGHYIRSASEGKAIVVPAITYADLAKNYALPQLVMALKKARLLYLTADPDANPDAYGTVATLLLWIQNMTRPAKGATTLHKHDNNEQATTASLYSASTALLQRLALKRNSFGDLPSYVPQGSLSFYHTLVDEMLKKNGTFAQIEQVYTTYFTALKQQKARLEQVGAARDQSKSLGMKLRLRHVTILKSASDIVPTINGNQTAVEEQEQIMLGAIKELEEEMAALAGVGCAFDSLVKGLGMIAEFTGNEDAKLASTISGTVNKVLQPGIGTALGIPGLPSADIVNQVDTLGHEVKTVNEGYVVGLGKVIESDPNAYKLLMSEAQLDKILQPYLNLAAAQRAKEAIGQYVTLVKRRNADLLKYNGYLAELLDLQSQLGQNKTHLGQVETALANKSDPALLHLVDFMASLYHNARIQAIHALYMVSRSFAFWSLNTKYSAFTEFVGLTDPSGIDSKTLNAAKQQLLHDLTKAIENFGTAPQDFPKNNHKAELQDIPKKNHKIYPQGIIFKLTLADNPGLFETFRRAGKAGDGYKRHQVSFTVPAATSETLESHNPFFGKANVRLTKVRPWVLGAKVDEGDLTVHIRHGGTDHIVDPHNTIHTFTHDPITKAFLFDPAPARVYQPDAISQDVNFSTGSKDAQYAQPGPFTVWTVIIDERYNTGLDMSQVDGISLELWGSSYPFNT